MASNPNREEILRLTDLAAEFQKYGGKVPPGAQPSPTGFLTVHSVDREDKKPSAALNVGNDPSKRGIYVDHAPTGKGAMSFFDIMCRLPGSPWMTGREVYLHYGRATGVLNGKASSSKKKTGNTKPKRKIVATYDYHDAAGNLLFQVCRMEPKDFLQRRPDGAGGWIWNLTGVEPVLYHLPELASAALVYEVEGEKDVDRLRTMGLVATCNPMGAGKWRRSYNQHLRGKVVILPDNDMAGKDHAQNVARELHGIAASVKVIALPGLQEKGDVSDWCDLGGTPEQLRGLVQAAPEWDPATASPPREEHQGDRSQAVPKDCGHYYAVSGDCHCLVAIEGDEVKKKPLCNFVAWVTDEVTRDDGARVTKEFIINGNIGAMQLPRARVPAKDFDKLSWVREHWGAMASIAPSRSNSQHLPNAVLSHSRLKGINQCTVYGHTGWREINGNRRYLHGGGGIGPGEPVEVDLGENLKNYRFPAPGGLEAAQASLRFLDVAPWEITAPLLACAYLAPFADLLKVDFSLWLYGPTGSMKSTLAALVLCHFGNFSRTTLPGSWFSTVNSLEKLCFTLKDCLVVIDDFMPAGNSKESNRMGESAGRLVYQSGNRSGRGRLAADLSARPDHRPRCLIISTGEILLPGQRGSSMARYLPVELDPKKTPIDKARLTAAQAESDLFSGAMAAYLEDLVPRLEDAQDELRGLFEAYREAFQKGRHPRIPEIQAWLAVGFEFAMRFFVGAGAITGSQAYEMAKRAWGVWEALGEQHSRIIEGERPTLKFLAILRELFVQGRIYAQSASMPGAPPQRKDELGWGKTEPERNADLVGWADEQNLYLLPELSFKAVHETVTRQGGFLTLGKNEMLAALAREGIIVPSGRGENTQVKWICGGSKRVVCLPLGKLFCGEDSEDGNG